MKVDLEPGSYVLAVSGGVDSMVLMHLLAQKPNVNITIAHFDHGIRDDSQLDRQLVQEAASRLRLPFIYDRAELGAGASEALARKHRYDFLRRVQQATGAQALVTAHHEDDLLETVLINLIRGTGRKGMSSLADRQEVRRPLLTLRKKDIRNYAAEQGLVWREDITNQDTKLLRNYLRQVVIPRISEADRRRLLMYASHVRALNRSIDAGLLLLLHTQPSRQTLDRIQFSLLPHSVAKELMAAWLRSHGIRNFDAKTIERLVAAAKTGLPGKQVDIDASHRLLLGMDVLALVFIDR